MIHIASFIETYGYLAVFTGSIFEGESIVLIGGFSAHEEYLSFFFVFLFAILGAIAGDWFFFFLGRNKKEYLFRRFSFLTKLIKIPATFVDKKPRMTSFTMRFMYGFRHVVPISIGASNIKTSQFLFWNSLGAITWAFVVTSAGYLAGDVLETIFGNIKRYEFRLVVLTILIVAVLSIFMRILRTALQRRDE